MALPSQTDWNNPGRRLFPEAAPTMFERIVAKLGLATEPEMLESPELKVWVQRHKDSRYVPESLLKKWGLRVNEGSGRIPIE